MDIGIFTLVGLVATVLVVLWAVLLGEWPPGTGQSITDTDEEEGLFENPGLPHLAQAPDEKLWRPMASPSVRSGRKQAPRVDHPAMRGGMFSGRGRREGTICWLTGESREHCSCRDCRRLRQGEGR
jgi:hypothetical protein